MDYDRTKDLTGEPQIYNGLEIYPIKVRDKYYLDLFYKIFLYPQHTIKEKKMLRLSYLKFFMFSGLSQTPKEDVESFLKYVIKQDAEIKYFIKDVNKKTISDIDDIEKLLITIGDKILDEYDFGEIRSIILKQNGLSIEYVKQYDEDLESRLRSTFTGEDIDYFDEILILSSLMNIDPKIILDEWTVYKMQEMLNRMITLEQYRLIKPLEVSGQITFKNGDSVKSYIYHSGDKGRYDSILLDRDKWINKFDDDLNKTVVAGPGQ